VSRKKHASAVGFPAVMLVTAALAGCSSGHKSRASDKAGGSSAPTILRLADSDAIDQPDTPTIQYFAARVAKLSGGALRVRITFQAAGDKVPNVEAPTARMVRAGKFDLGWIGARAWDELGVESFQALQAPFLVTSYALLDRIAMSTIAEEMLAGLRSQDVVGLALVPDQLRHPVGLGRPLSSSADFAGARIRIQPSRATQALMTALGAAPVAVSGSAVPAAIAHHRIDGEELSFGNAPGGSIVTANVTFFGKALTLFAARRAYDRLTDVQRDVLRRAAEQTVRHVITDRPSESALARRFCGDDGSIVLASKRELTELELAAQPVYGQLERHPQTAAFIARIRKLKARTPRDPPLVVPAGCAPGEKGAPPSHGKLRSPSIVNGTYHVLFTRADAIAFGPPANTPENLAGTPAVNTRILDDGKWRFGGGDRGTYTIRGETITFVAPAYGSVESFTFGFDRQRELHLKPVLPMDRGDQWVMAGEPWQRVGPPTKIR
jgi:TRAP-type C4-dicarboxylate transport system substrate-binding protein